MTPNIGLFFNISTTAGLYSQLAGVLAGFAFAALILLLTGRITPGSTGATTSGHAFARATRVLVVAFIGLVITSVDYAVLAGDTSGSPRSATLELLSGLAFATSGALLMYAVALTFDGVNAAIDSTANADLLDVGCYIRRVLAIIVTPLLLFLLYLGVQDFKYASNRSRLDSVDLVSLSMIAFEIVAGASYYRYRTRHCARRLSNVQKEAATRRMANGALTLTLAASIGVSVASAVLNTPRQAVSISVPIVIMVVTVVSAAGFVVHLARTQT